jgi:three-Cys-motif partner protein
MVAKDFHKNEFDDGTLIKLHVFKEYLKAWLPVFVKIKKPYWDKIFIYDFFAGSGTDGKGSPGSPMIIIEELKNFCTDLKQKGLSLKVVFNEFDEKKKEKLLEISQNYLDQCRISKESKAKCPNYNQKKECVFALVIENKDFKVLFDEIYDKMIRYPKFPRFMFLDQFGIKHINKEVFSNLITLERTDFIFFISSFHAKRFSELPEFKKYLNISKSDFNEKKSYQCHRVIFEYYKSQVPSDKEFYLAPFSIKKGNNIYGLIFGSNHKLGIEKFLKICWKINPNTGDANFDIDDEKIDPQAPKLFAQFDIPNKLQLFKRRLEEKILSSEIKTNIDIYTFAFDMGCLPKHANPIIKEMIKSKKIDFINLSAENIHRLEEQSIKVLKQ